MNGKVASLCYRLLADKLYESNVNNYTVEIIETSFLGPPSQAGVLLLPHQKGQAFDETLCHQKPVL